MKIIARIAAVAAVVLVIGFQVALPDPTIRLAHSQASLLVGAQLTPQVASIIERSCQNCHSLKTEWPLYSRVYPFSLLVEGDVAAARTHMNLSRWQSYDNAEKSALLAEIGSVARTHVMPPRRYTLIHPEAKLSEADANEIYEWTRAERHLLRTAEESAGE